MRAKYLVIFRLVSNLVNITIIIVVSRYNIDEIPKYSIHI